MAWSGGTFTRANPTWASDAAGGTGIEPGRHDAQDNDFTTGINQCINKDGSNSCTGDLNLGGFKPVNITAGTAAAPAICVGNDVNTGIFSPAADQIGIATNGIERVRISATAGNILELTGSSQKSIIINSSTGTHTLGVFNDAIGISANRNIATGAIFDTNKATGEIVVTGASGGSTISFGTTNVNGGSPIERMHIDSAGYVGINQTPTVGAGLAVKSKTNNGTDHTIILTNSSGTVLFQQDSNGAMYSGLGSSSPYNLHTLNAANMYVESTGLLYRSVSASKYKDDIQNMSYGLNTVKQLRPVTYKLKGDATSNRRFAGLIAEEVNDLGLTEFVQYDANNQPDALNYSHFVALAFKAIQELSAKVEELEARLPEVSEPA